MNKKITLIACLVVSVLAASCAHVPSVDVSVTEPDRIRFQGKGAGAGMMLMSSMGSMGIAIGIAIDEGIGKDINKTADAAGFDIEQMLREEINEQFKQAPNLKVKTDKIKVVVERYGFITRSGENDTVAAQLHVSLIVEGSGPVLVRYPEDFSDQENVIVTAPLDEIKINESDIELLMREAARKIAFESIKIMQ